MKKLITILVTIICLYGCSPKEVDFHESNAKYKGVMTWDITGADVTCCDPGNNCVKKGSYHNDQVPVIHRNLRVAIKENKLSEYFTGSQWKQEFPIMMDFPTVLNYIVNNNPKALITKSDNLVIFKSPISDVKHSDEILLTIETSKMAPCNGNNNN
jgi:hypothetical protein